MSGCKAITVNTVSGRRMLKSPIKLLLFLTVFALALSYTSPRHAAAGPFPEKNSGYGGGSVEQVYFYPREGQTPEQQDRDRYECYNWAMQQTGFDPSRPSLSPQQHVRVVLVPPAGHDTVALGVTGAMLGALAAGPRNAPGGALIGAALGLITGAVSDSERQESARRMEEAYAASDRARDARPDWKALEYRRAMTACLEGRGYSVR